MAEKDQWRKKRLENGVWRAESRRIEVTACRTKANRFFHVRCKQSKQCSYGQFGTWEKITMMMKMIIKTEVEAK